MNKVKKDYAPREPYTVIIDADKLAHRIFIGLLYAVVVLVWAVMLAQIWDVSQRAMGDKTPPVLRYAPTKP